MHPPPVGIACASDPASHVVESKLLLSQHLRLLLPHYLRLLLSHRQLRMSHQLRLFHHLRPTLSHYLQLRLLLLLLQHLLLLLSGSSGCMLHCIAQARAIMA